MKIITIGRELAAGGRTIGKMVANKLAIPYYDRELIDKAAIKAGFSVPFVESSDQTITNSLLYNLTMGISISTSSFKNSDKEVLPLSEQVYIAQKEVITDYASKGSCVIVGRCADYILKDYDILRVFIHSDMDKRAERAVKEYGMNKDTVVRELKKSDQNRSRHYNIFTDQTWGDKNNYDLVLNSSTLGFDHCASIICTAAEN